jgi:type VI secretion system protein ImpA
LANREYIRDLMNNEALLAPIAGDLPCGTDLSFSAAFDQIAEMRREDDPTLSQGEWVTALKVADWSGVVRQCSELLSRQTKDLRLAQWLTEALALTQGYAGLLQGLQLCTALCQSHWDSLHPQADNGDMDQRVGNMTWLLQRLGPLTAARALREVPKSELRTTLQTMRACEQQLLDWQAVVDGQLGAQGPSFVAAKEALSSAVHDLEHRAREAGVLGGADADSSSSLADDDFSADADHLGGEAPIDGAGPHYSAKGPLRSRAQALQQLRDVAAFFRRTEPHSPVAYLAEKAVKWGDMPLHEWLRKVVKDQGSMSHLHELLGVEPDDGPTHL